MTLAARTRGVVHHADGAGLSGRRGRGQLRLLDGEHQRLLPGSAQGLGARPQRRRRQPRRAGGAAGRPGGAGHRRGRAPPAGARGLHAADRPRGAGGARAGMDNLARRATSPARCARPPATRTPGSCPCSTSAPSARSSASASPSGRCSSFSSREQFPTPVDAACLTFLGPAGRLADPAARRAARRPARRGPGDVLELRRHGGGRRAGAVRGPGASPCRSSWPGSWPCSSSPGSATARRTR